MKVDAAGEYIATLIEGGLKFLVFGHHQEVLDGLEAAVIKACGKGSRHIRIDGSTGMQDRQDMVRSFQNDQNVQVMNESSTPSLSASNLEQFSETKSEVLEVPAIGALDLEHYLPRELLVLSITAAGTGLASTLDHKP